MRASKTTTAGHGTEFIAPALFRVLARKVARGQSSHRASEGADRPGDALSDRDREHENDAQGGAGRSGNR
jgi:hypothetical protein